MDIYSTYSSQPQAFKRQKKKKMQIARWDGSREVAQGNFWPVDGMPRAAAAHVTLLLILICFKKETIQHKLTLTNPIKPICFLTLCCFPSYPQNLSLEKHRGLSCSIPPITIDLFFFCKKVEKEVKEGKREGYLQEIVVWGLGQDVCRESSSFSLCKSRIDGDSFPSPPIR